VKVQVTYICDFCNTTYPSAEAAAICEHKHASLSELEIVAARSYCNPAMYPRSGPLPQFISVRVVKDNKRYVVTYGANRDQAKVEDLNPEKPDEATRP